MTKSILIISLLIFVFSFPITTFSYDGLLDKQSMDLNKACNNQYKNEGYNSLYQYTPDHKNPWSWECRRLDNQKTVGGIDLYKYCQEKSWDNLTYFLIGDTAYDFVCAKTCYNVITIESQTKNEIRHIIIGKNIYNQNVLITEYIHILSNGEQRISKHKENINNCIN
jgi:hypothetical protein